MIGQAPTTGNRLLLQLNPNATARSLYSATSLDALLTEIVVVSVVK
jgi:hypothetical protein